MGTQLSKGGNTALNAAQVVVTVDLPVSADLTALLVTESGKVRSDDDFIFYNQPTGPGVRAVQSGGSWKLDIDTNAVPADVHAVRVVTALDGGGTFAGHRPVAHVRDGSGTDLIDYQVDGLGPEAIVVVLELYRRQGAWKVRAVGQGYAGGLADLIRDHGVSVDDEPAPAASTPVAAPPAPVAPPAPTAPPASTVPPPAPSFGQPAPPAPSFGQSAPAPSFGQAPPPAPPSAPSFGQASASAPSFGQAPPPTAPAQPNQPAQPGGAPSGEVSLSKSRPVSLSKGQKVTLTKDQGEKLTLIRMGLGWDPVKTGGLFGRREVQIDLDATAVLIAGSDVVDMAFYNHLASNDGSVQHMGDNRTGAGDGDDEVIMVDLTRVPVHVDTIFFIVTSYEGHTFQQVANAFVRLVDHTSGAELARYTLSGGNPHTGMIMARVYRDGSNWKLQAIGEGIQAKVPHEAIGALVNAKRSGQFG